MKAGRKLLVLICAVIMTVMFAGCGASGDMQKGVTIGRSVFVDEEGTAYFGYGRDIYAAQMKGIELSGFRRVASADSPVYSLALLDGSLYVTGGRGISRYQLPADGSVSTDAELITQAGFKESAQFEIFEDSIYFLQDGTLCSAPLAGGVTTELVSGVTDFEVTGKGLCYVKSNGNLFLANFDGSDDKSLGKLPKGSEFTFSGGDLYYSNEGIIERFSVKKKASSDTGNAEMASNKCVPWADGEYIYYADERLDCHLITGSGEQDTARALPYPDKADGAMHEGCLISVSENGGGSTLQVIDYVNTVRRQYDLKKEISKLN